MSARLASPRPPPWRCTAATRSTSSTPPAPGPTPRCTGSPPRPPSTSIVVPGSTAGPMSAVGRTDGRLVAAGHDERHLEDRLHGRRRRPRHDRQAGPVRPVGDGQGRAHARHGRPAGSAVEHRPVPHHRAAVHDVVRHRRRLADHRGPAGAGDGARAPRAVRARQPHRPSLQPAGRRRRCGVVPGHPPERRGRDTGARTAPRPSSAASRA